MADELELSPIGPESAGTAANPPPLEIKHSSKSTVKGAIANFVNSIIGAGIVGLPYALHEAGLGAGLLLLLAIAGMTVYSAQLIIQLGVAAGKLDFEALCEHAFGPAGFVCITVSMFLFAAGAMISYLVILADTAAAVFAHWAGYQQSIMTRRAVLSVVALSCLLPLCLIRDMSKLARTSALSIVAIVWIVFFVTLRSLGPATGAVLPAGDLTHIAVISQDVFPAIGVFAFAFVCQHNSFIVFNSLSDSSTSAWARTARYSVLIATIACAVLALFGFLQFRGLTQGNLLNNYAWDDELANFTRLTYSITMVLTYPQEMFVARHCVFAFVRRRSSRLTAVSAEDDTISLMNLDDGALVPVSTCAHVAVSLVLFFCSLTIALLTQDLGFILEITGSVSATILGFIMPAALFFKLTDTKLAFWRHPSSAWTGLREAAAGIVLGAFGIVAFLCSTGLTLVKAFR